MQPDQPQTFMGEADEEKMLRGLIFNAFYRGSVRPLVEFTCRVLEERRHLQRKADLSQLPPTMSDRYLDFVFTGPPGHTMPQLIEVEDEQGKSIQVGTWLQRDDGAWVLRLPMSGELVVTPAE